MLAYAKLGLEQCITTKSASEPVARDRWSKYHQLMKLGTPQVTAVTSNHALAVLLSFQVFQTLIDKATKEESTPLASNKNEVTPEEVDISAYIGGSIVFKLKKRYTASRNDSHNGVLTYFIDRSATEQPFSFPSLTSVKSRGGLINLTSPGRAIFQQLEVKFRYCYPEGRTQMSSDEFREACHVDCIFTDHFPKTSMDVEQQVFKDMVLLYFKIRSYSTLQNRMEMFYYKSRQSKKQKALRKTLKS